MNLFRFYLIMIICLLLLLISCKKDEEDNVFDKESLVINELMAINTITAADQDGEYDDWIELYNLSVDIIDLSGFYLTDSKSNLTKWKFPDGTIISGSDYLIIWADKDTTQDGLHTNYKLSSEGENLVLLTPGSEKIDEVKFGNQASELSFARIPNGTGTFVWNAPTFNGPNE